jgi:hypothetical protein
MLTVVPDDDCDHERGEGSSSLIDEIVREGARRMLAEALAAEVGATSPSSPPSGMRTAVGWWSEMATTEPGGADQRGRGAGDRAAGQRQAR